jgi:hypothetical protein
MLDSNSVNCYNESLRQRVFALLNEYPWLTAKNICRILKLQYKQHCAYVNNLKYSWKSNHKNEQGSKCSSVHSWRGYFCVPYFIRRDLAVEVGWVLSKARNRWLLWKDKLGRMMWFETGRVELYVRQPANLGKAKQLICNGFTKTGLIEDVKKFEQVLVSLKFRGAHYVFDSGYPLPKMTIDAFSKSNGITIRVGDKSHPRAVEVISRYPDWAERNENLLEEIKTWLSAGSYRKDFSKKPCYVA